MHATISTDRVARAFHRNHATYDQHAIVQRSMARELVNPLRDYCPHRLDPSWSSAAAPGSSRASWRKLRSGSLHRKRPRPRPRRKRRRLPETRRRPVACLPGDIEAVTEFPRAVSDYLGGTFQWLRDTTAFSLESPRISARAASSPSAPSDPKTCASSATPPALASYRRSTASVRYLPVAWRYWSPGVASSPPFRQRARRPAPPAENRGERPRRMPLDAPATQPVLRGVRALPPFSTAESPSPTTPS